METATCIHHFFALVWYIFLNYYIAQQKKDPKLHEFFDHGGQWKYLTFLNVGVFFGVAFLEDVLKIMKGKKNIKFLTAFRDLLFSSLAFPMSTFVSVTFWGLFLYNRELIYPKALDSVLPPWSNHAVHTIILPLSLVEFVLRPCRYPSKLTGLGLFTIADFLYGIRLLKVHCETGKWVYPVLNRLSPVSLLIFFFISYVTGCGAYLLGEKLNHWKWGDVTQAKKGK